MKNTVDFNDILRQVVLANSPELFIRASKIEHGLIEDITGSTVVKSYYNGHAKPALPDGMRYDAKPSDYVYCEHKVLKHMIIENKVLLDSGQIVSVDSLETGRKPTPIVPIEE